MSNFLLKIFVFSFLFQGYIPRVLQTLYSDSPSNNYYYAVLYLGKNFTRLTYLIDTRLDVMTAPCHSCYFCNRNKTNFFYGRRGVKRRIGCDSDICGLLPSIGCLRPKDYIKNRQCSFLSIDFNGNGVRGYFIKEHVFFQDDRLPVNGTATDVYASHYMATGCSLGEFGKYKNISVDGFLGLNGRNKSFVNMLSNLSMNRRGIFTICLGDGLGYLSIGTIIRRYHTSDQIKYAKIINTSIDAFQLDVYRIKIQKTLKVNVTLASIINSVSPFSYFPRWIYRNVMIYKTWRYFNKTGRNFSKIFFNTPDKGYCTHYNSIEEMNYDIQTWPNINISFVGGKFFWYPENYFYRADNNTACLGFKSHNFSYIIFGNNLMRGKDIIFDYKKQRIGFVDADCDKIIYKNYTENNTNITTNIPEYANSNNVMSVVLNNTEFMYGRNELYYIRDYNLFNRTIEILFYSSITFIFFFFIIVIIKLYKIYKNKIIVANLDEEHKKLRQSDYEC